MGIELVNWLLQDIAFQDTSHFTANHFGLRRDMIF